MPDTTQEATGIKEQYAAQVTADLERNVKEQERVAAEVAALQEQLRVLRQDHALLVSVRQALGGEASAGPAGPAEPLEAEATQVPKPRGSTPARTTSRRRKAASKTAGKGGGAEKPAKTEKPAKARAKEETEAGTGAGTEAGTEAGETAETAGTPAKAARTARTGSAGTRAKKAPGGASAPTLVTLVREYLAQQSEPLSAAEITAALTRTHPERTVRPTVVRTTAEGLVAKGQAHRSKQGTSVFYTAVGAPSVPLPPAAQAERPEKEAEPETV